MFILIIAIIVVIGFILFYTIRIVPQTEEYVIEFLENIKQHGVQEFIS